MERWPHQTQAFASTIAAIEMGEQGILLTSPTGGGKSVMMTDLIRWALERSWRVVLYTNRKMLLDQLSGVLDKHGITHGVRASDHDANLLNEVQISSIQTELARVYKSERWSLHLAKLVIIDEAHNNCGDTAKRIIEDHRAKGAFVVGYTATPLGLSGIYAKLIVAGNPSELRDCGALVPCNTYGPDEPDTKAIKKLPSGEFSENDVRKVFKIQQVFGRIFEWWKKLNPDARPTILFAPGVKESVWCAQQFEQLGVRAAHIDGEDIYLDGRAYDSDRKAREDLLEQIRDGRVKVVCNRFVLREGIDLPELYHGILATVFGGLQSYLQSGGRLLRAHPSLDHVVLQDHGGNWHRHGSLNADREWDLDYTNNIVTGLREQAMREKREQEPIVCPQCGRVRLAGKQCPQCEYESPKKTRIIMQTDGTLREMQGDIYKPRRVKRYLGIDDDWKRMYFRGKSRCKKGENCTFVALEALFARENYWNYPPRDLPLMPKYPADWFRPVTDVPPERLITP